MKKLISLLMVIVMLASMCSITVLAVDARTITVSTTLEDGKANVGDEFSAYMTLDTSNTVKTVGGKIAFDSNDIELGLSESAKSINISEYESFLGTPGFETVEDIYFALINHQSYVDDTYYNTYKGYDTKNFGNATIDYEVKNGLGLVTFGYAASIAKNALNKVDNMLIGGVALKVKTSEKKQTTITIVEAASSDTTNARAEAIVNTITLNLNGYGEEPEGPVVPTADSIGLATANGVVVEGVEATNKNDGSKYALNSALVFVSSVDKDYAPVKTVITRAESDKELVITPDSATTIGEKIYFAAAVSSIKETSIGKTFTAKAYAQAGEYLVEGAAATGVYPAE